MELIIVFTLILFFSALNISQILWAWTQTPKDQIFIGITHWYEDFFFYLSHLTQGATGRWLTTNWYTSEVLPPSPGWWTNILLGKIGGVLGVDPWVSYRVTLFLLSVVFLWVIYRTLTLLFPKNSLIRIGGCIISYSATGLFILTKGVNGFTVSPFDFFFTPTLSLNRLGGTIHQVATNILSLIILWVSAGFIEIINGKKIQKIVFVKNIIMLVFLYMLTFLLNPATAVILLVCFSLTLCFFVWKNTWYDRIPVIAGTVIFITLALTPLFVFYIKTVSHPFYQFSMIAFERRIPPTDILTLILSTGIVFFLLPFGLIPFLKLRTPLAMLGITYILFPAALYFSPIPKLAGLQYHRILQPSSYAFIGAIAGIGLWTIVLFLEKHIRISRSALYAAAIVVFLLLQAPVLRIEVDRRLQASRDFTYFDRIDRPFYEALNRLKKEPFGLTLAPYRESLYIPVVSGKSVWAGHRMMTIEFERKTGVVNEFFTILWDKKTAQDFFGKNAIRYVLLPQQTRKQEFESAYPFLTPLWSNATFTIYKTSL